jgi:hypothetical protein
MSCTLVSDHDNKAYDNVNCTCEPLSTDSMIEVAKTSLKCGLHLFFYEHVLDVSSTL